MIVTDATAHAVSSSAPGTVIGRRCLARRGMLHSECEAVDHVTLAPAAAVERLGRSGVDEVWFLLSGEVTARSLAGAPARLRTGELLLSPAGEAPLLVAGPAGAQLLHLCVLGVDRSALLPSRSPEVSS